MLSALTIAAACAWASGEEPSVSIDGRRYTVDARKATLRIEAASFGESEAQSAGRVFPSYAEAASEARKYGIPILPSLGGFEADARRIDEGFRAAVELVLDRGKEGVTIGKREFLARLLGKLLETEASAKGYVHDAAELAAVYVAAGLAAGGQTPENLPPRVRGAVAEFAEGLRFMPEFKPAGIYTRDPRLMEICRREVYFRRGLSFSSKPAGLGAIMLIVKSIRADGVLAREHAFFTRAAAIMMNPSPTLSVEDLSGTIPLAGPAAPEDAEGWRERVSLAPRWVELEEEHEKLGREILFTLLPGARSVQEDLFAKTAANTDGLIMAIRSGEADLAPQPGSGWYQYRHFALQGLINPEATPEAKRIDFGPEYRKRIEKASKSISEPKTEAPAAATGATGATGATISPRLRVEPLPSAYLRLARGYRFVRTQGARLFGEKAFSEIKVLREDGSFDDAPAAQSLMKLESALWGLHIIACRDLAMPDQAADLSADERREAIAAAEELLGSGAFSEADARSVASAFADESGATYWSTIGVRLVKVRVGYLEPPQLLDEEGRPAEVKAATAPAEYLIPTDAFCEFKWAPGALPPTQEEFRSLCGAAPASPERIAAAIGSAERVIHRPGKGLLGVLSIGGILLVVGGLAARRRHSVL